MLMKSTTQKNLTHSMKKSKLKILTIVGTRPEIIRLSVIIKKLNQLFNHKLIFTNQNFSKELSTVFFKELNIKKPDYTLKINNRSVGQFYGDVLKNSEKFF